MEDSLNLSPILTQIQQANFILDNEDVNDNEIEHHRLHQQELQDKGIGSFSAVIKDVKSILFLLRPIYNTNDNVICVLSEDGIEFIKDLSGVMQFRVLLNRERFESIEYYANAANKSKLHFGLSLEHFIKAIDFLEPAEDLKSKPKLASTKDKNKNLKLKQAPRTKAHQDNQVMSLFVSYDEYSAQLILTMKNEKVITQTKLFCYEAPLPDIYYLMDTDDKATITIRSQFLKDALNMIHPKSETISIKLSGEYPNLVISGISEVWETESGYPYHDAISENFIAPIADNIIGYYKYKHIMEIYHGLDSSEKAIISINGLGFLLIKFHMEDGISDECVQFFCSPILK